MRSVIDQDQFTPFGIWIRQYLRADLSVTNLDYVVEDYKQKRIMCVEEKQCGGKMHRGQLLTFKVLNRALRGKADSDGYDYWGLFVVQFPRNCTMVGPGVTLNGKACSVEQLRDHLNFKTKFCEGLTEADFDQLAGLLR